MGNLSNEIVDKFELAWKADLSCLESGDSTQGMEYQRTWFERITGFSQADGYFTAFRQWVRDEKKQSVGRMNYVNDRPDNFTVSPSRNGLKRFVKKFLP